MPHIIDDKSPHVIPFILDRLKHHRKSSSDPFFIGLNGVQGIGKTTLVSSLAAALRAPPHNLPTLTFSIDDLYLPRAEQAALAAAHPSNPLIQHRGQPSTHDIPLGLKVLRAIRARAPDIQIPAYNKSAYKGQGDRVPTAQWPVVNSSSSSDSSSGPIEVVIFEGWCVGFRALSDAALEAKWRAARTSAAAADDTHTPPSNTPAPSAAGRLRNQRLEDVAFVNAALRTQGYDELFAHHLDAFVYLDAEATEYVYAWRMEQEAALRRDKGEDGAMSDEDVVRFVDGYYPAYELFADGVRRGVFRGDDDDDDNNNKNKGSDGAGRQMRLVVGRDRAVLYTEIV